MLHARRGIATILFILLTLIGITTGASAQVRTWDAGAGSTIWNNDNNWGGAVGAVPDSIGEDVVVNAALAFDPETDGSYSVGSVNVTAGSLTINLGHTLTVRGSITENGGDITGTGTLQIEAGQTVTMLSDLTVTNLTIPATAVLDTNGNNLTVSGTFTLAGALRHNGSGAISAFTTNTGTVVYYTGPSTGLPAGNSYNHLEFESGTWTLNAALSVSGNLTVSGATLDVSGSNYKITVGGTWNRSAGSFNRQNGEVEFNGTGAIQNAEQFDSLRFSAGTRTANAALMVATTLFLDGGVFVPNNNNHSIAGTWDDTNVTFTPGSGTITLTSTNPNISQLAGNNFFNLTLSDGGSFQAATDIDGNFSATGLVAQGGNALTVAGSTNINAAGNPIILGAAGNDFQSSVTLATTGANAITIQDANSIDFTGITTTDNLTVTAGSNVTDTGAVSVSGTASITAGGLITLNTAANDFGLAVSVPSATNVTLFDTDNIDLGAMSVTSLTVTAGGAVTQSGILTVSGDTSVGAGAGNNITLTNGSNDFTGGVRIVSGLNVGLQDTNAIVLGNGSGASTISGTLAVTAAGTITQANVLGVTGTTNLTAGAGNDIALINAGNNFTGGVRIVSGLNVSLQDTDAIVLGNASGASTVSGTLSVTSNGAMTQAGAMTVTGTTSLTAGAANDVTLYNASNDFQSDVTVVSGNNVSIQDSGALSMATSTVSAFLDILTGGTFTMAPGNAVTCVGATLTVEDIDIGFGGGVNAGAGDITVTTKTPANTISLGGGADLGISSAELKDRLTTTGIKIVGDISHTGIIQTSGAITGIGNDVELRTSGGNIIFTNDFGLNANLDLTADTRGGGATTGQVTGAGIITVTGTGVFTVNASAGVNVAGGAVDIATINNDTSGNIIFTNSNGAGVSVSGSNGGAGTNTIAESTGALTVDVSDFTATGGTIDITAAGLLTVTGNVTSGGGNIALLSNGITQGAGSTINAGAGTVAIDADSTAAGAINLSGLISTTSASASAVTIQDGTTAALGNITATNGTVIVGVAQDITGALTQNGGTTLNVGTLTVSTANTITLTSGTNTIGTLGSVTRGGAVDINDSTGGLSVTGPVTGGTITNAVAITTAGGALAVNGNISTSGANNITLTGNGVTQGGGSTIDGGSGTITIDGDSTAAGAINMSGALTTTNAGASAVTVQDATTVALGNVTATSGTFVLGAGDIGGAVTQNGGTALNVSSIVADFNNTATLTAAGNAIVTLGAITRDGAFSLNDGSGGLTVNGLITGGTTTNNVSITTAGGALTINANITATVGGAVSLTGPNVTNTATIRGDGGVTIDATTAGTGTVDNTGGTITNNSLAGAISLTGDSISLAGGTITGGSGNVSLTSTTLARTITVGTGGTQLGLTNGEIGTITTTGTLTIGDASHSGIITVDGALNITTASGPVVFRTNGGAITHNFSVQANGSLTLDTGTSAAVDINAGVTATGGFSSNGTTFDNTGGTITTTNTAITINHSAAVTIAAALSSGSGNTDIDSTAPDHTEGISVIKK